MEAQERAKDKRSKGNKIVKLLILGHGGCGKDTAAEFITNHFGLTFKSSSFAACVKAVFPTLSKTYDYETPQQCFEDRRNHRQEWFELISKYNTPDKGKLCKEILKESDGYIGMRCAEELEAVRDLFDVIIWVDASKRIPPESSMTIEQDESMIVIDNNGTLNDLSYNCWEALT